MSKPASRKTRKADWRSKEAELTLLEEAIERLKGIKRISVNVTRGPRRTTYVLRYSVPRES